MRIALILLVLLILAGCGGGSSSRANPGEQQNNNGASDAAGSVKLTLDAVQEGNVWRINLRAPRASDLYQVAGTLAFDTLKYDVVAVEAGGGLGTPENSYFAGQETSPGRVAFAYTRRYYGAGVSGDTWLVSLRVSPSATFSLSDFTLLQGDGAVLCRDSQKRKLAVSVGGAK